MKKTIMSVVTGLLLTASVYAQSPEKMSYQAVVRNASNELVISTKVGMQISILGVIDKRSLYFMKYFQVDKKESVFFRYFV